MESKQASKAKISIEYPDEEVKRVELPDQKGVVVRVLKRNDQTYLDIRRFYKGFPTKKGIRLTLDSFNILKELI